MRYSKLQSRQPCEVGEDCSFSKSRQGMTPDEEPTAALACEEVFDDIESCDNVEATS